MPPVLIWNLTSNQMEYDEDEEEDEVTDLPLPTATQRVAYQKKVAAYEDFRRRYGESHTYTTNAKKACDDYDKIYNMRPVDPEIKAKSDADKNYIEIKKGGIRVRLDVNEISIDVSSKMKYTKQNVETLTSDLQNALDVISKASALDDKLKPKTSVEL